MPTNELGNLFVISGPSGVGKDTLMAFVLSKIPSLKRWITVTSRKPRKGEVEGKDYFFLSKNDFKRLIDEGGLVEWNEFAGNFYGTPKKFADQNIKLNNNVVACVDVNGALNIKKEFPNAHLIFIAPPSLEVLRKRLENRGTESCEQIEERLNIVVSELEKSNFFDKSIINDDLFIAQNELLDTIKYYL